MPVYIVTAVSRRCGYLKKNVMKTSLRERLELMLTRINSRITMLENSIKEYKANNDFENAMKCDIKRATFKLLADDLRKELLE